MNDKDYLFPPSMNDKDYLFPSSMNDKDYLFPSSMGDKSLKPSPPIRVVIYCVKFEHLVCMDKPLNLSFISLYAVYLPQCL